MGRQKEWYRRGERLCLFDGTRCFFVFGEFRFRAKGLFRSPERVTALNFSPVRKVAKARSRGEERRGYSALRSGSLCPRRQSDQNAAETSLVSDFPLSRVARELRHNKMMFSADVSPTKNHLPLLRLPALALPDTETCPPMPLTYCGAVFRYYAPVPIPQTISYHRTMNCNLTQRQLLTSQLLSSFVGRQPKLDEMDLAPYRSCRRAVSTLTHRRAFAPKQRGARGVPWRFFPTFVRTKVGRRRPTPAEGLLPTRRPSTAAK